MLRPLMIREPSLDAVAEAIQVPFRASSRRAAAGGISAAAVQHGRGHSVVNPRAAQVLRAEMLEEEINTAPPQQIHGVEDALGGGGGQG